MLFSKFNIKFNIKVNKQLCEIINKKRCSIELDKENVFILIK